MLRGGAQRVIRGTRGEGEKRVGHMKRVLQVGGVCLLLLLLYLVAWPVPINPIPWTPPPAPDLVGPYARNTALAAVERLPLGDAVGPEDVTLGPDGRLYTGVLDGRILRMMPDGSGLEVFAETGGRPQSLEFDAGGNLVVCDTYRGLLSIDTDRNITVLTAEANGVPFRFTNDLHIASYGTIYFTDASSKFDGEHVIEALLEHGGNGRLLAYVPARNETRVLLDGLQFANGVALDPHERFVLVNETGAYRTRRVWLSGPKAGQVDTFIDNLPGFPDNISWNGTDTYWLALPSPRDPAMDAALMPSPFRRRLIMRLPESVRPAAQHYGFVLGLDVDGRVVHNLQDPAPDCYWYITSVNEFDGRLYLGSLAESAIGRLPVPPRPAPLPPQPLAPEPAPPPAPEPPPAVADTAAEATGPLKTPPPDVPAAPEPQADGTAPAPESGGGPVGAAPAPVDEPVADPAAPLLDGAEAPAAPVDPNADVP